jgi:PAS domain S-box-containing protein
MLTGLVGGRLLYLLDRTDILHSALPLGLFGMTFEFLMYAIALFGFRIFDTIVLARQVAVAQMHDGVLVLDPQGRIVSLNPAAVAILGVSGKNVHGRLMREILLSYSDPQDDGMDKYEISLGTGLETRDYQLETSALKDWRDLEIGRLLLLHDVTAQKRAQAQILEQQRALAALQERELVARELHDGLGQVLAYVRVQAQAARDWLAQDQKAAADSSLAQLIAVAQDAHTDVREYILGAKTAALGQVGLLAALQHYLQEFSRLYSLRTELVAPEDWVDGMLEPTTEAQLLRIIQEALTNARKHAKAQCVDVAIQNDTNYLQVIVQDDGVGFDPATLASEVGLKYGLGFMRERAEDVGGSVVIHSAPGQGTRIVVEVPTIITPRRQDAKIHNE